MSDLNDYPDEMRKPRPLDDRAVEAFFAGRTPPDEDLLGAFAQSVRAFAHQPAPSPRGDLAAVLVDGLTIDKGDLAVTPASKVTGPSREVSGLPKWRRPRMTVSGLLSALMTKLGALSLAAKAGLAIVLAAAGVTAAGATGALPGPVQNVVSHAVNDVTPFSFPTSNSHAAFGGKVSTTATHDHGVSGSTVSSLAKKQGSTERANPSTGAPTNAGPQGSTGLNRANSTPAAGHAPTAVPTNSASQSGASSASQSGSSSGAPTNPGSQSSTTGLSQAGTTPAASHAPTSVPTPTNPGSQSGASSGSQSGTHSGSGTRP